MLVSCLDILDTPLQVLRKRQFLVFSGLPKHPRRVCSVLAEPRSDRSHGARHGMHSLLAKAGSQY